MNNQRTIQNRLGRSVAAAALVLGALWSAPAYAVAPANTTITNTATLTYTGNATGIAATVDFKVTLKPSAPGFGTGPAAVGALSLVGPADNTVVAGQSSVATYVITSNANGPDTYNLSGPATATSLTGASASAAYKDAANAAITSVTLGATAAAAASTGTAITVPADGTADSSINGIVANDWVNIGGNIYSVASVTDNATGTSTITLTTAATVTVGTLIGEVQTFTMNLATVGLVNGAGPNVSVTTTATSAADALVSASDVHVTNVTEVTFAKYVRNVTTPVVGGGATVTVNAKTFYTTGVTAKSGETVEYALVVTAPAAAGVAGAAITDAVPTFTTYVANSTLLNGVTVAGDGATSPVAAGLTIDDNAARGAGAVAAGTLAAGASANVTFQVTVN